MPSRTSTWLQSAPLETRHSKTIQHSQQQTANTTTINPTISLHKQHRILQAANSTIPTTNPSISSYCFIDINWKVYALDTPSTPQLLQPTNSTCTPRYTDNSNHSKCTFTLKYANETSINSQFNQVWKHRITELHFNPSTDCKCSRKHRWRPKKKQITKNCKL